MGTTSATNIQKLFVIQKKFLRVICNKPRDFHSAPLFSALKTLKLPALINLRLLTTYRRYEKNIGALSSLANLTKRETPTQLELLRLGVFLNFGLIMASKCYATGCPVYSMILPDAISMC